MEKQYEEGVSIGELCRMIGKHIWKVLLASAACAVVLTLLFAFVVNPLSREYSMEFYLSYPGSDTLKYPDGSSFSYRELIAYEALSSARNSDESLSSVDIDKMVKEDDIGVTAEFVTVNERYVQTGDYTITVQGKYFSSRETAQLFIRKLAETAVDSVIGKASGVAYTIDTEVFSQATFSEKLTLLAEQRESILSAYDEWIAEYRSGYQAGGKTLSQYRAEAAVACGESELATLQNELEMRGYVPLDEMEGRIAELKLEQVLNEEKIAALRDTLDSMTTGIGSDSAIAEMIAELVVRNVQIESEIAALTEENISAFEGKVQKLYGAMQSAAETLRSVSVALCEQETNVHFITNRAAVSGEIGLAVIAVGGFLLGFLVAGIVVCRMGLKRPADAAAPEDGEKQTDPDGEHDGE